VTSEWDDGVAREVLRLELAAFFRQRRRRAASSSPIMIRASEPPMKQRRFSNEFVHIGCFIARSKSPKWLIVPLSHYGSYDPKRIPRYQ